MPTSQASVLGRSKARAAEARAVSKRKRQVKKYEAWALKYTPSRPAAGGRTAQPPTIRRKLLYSTSVTINPAAGVVGYHSFAANGLYDPDLTGVGHQPRGFDQYMALYNHYKVHASKIIVQNATISTAGVVLLCQSSDGAAAAGSVSEWIEKSQTSWKTAISTGPGVALVNNDFQLKRDLAPQVAEADIKGDASNNPAELWYYHVAVGPDDEASDVTNQYVRVVIEFDVEFFGPLVPAAS